MKDELLAKLDTHSVTGYQCNRALRRVIELADPGPEPQRADYMTVEVWLIDHAIWQARTAIYAALAKELL